LVLLWCVAASGIRQDAFSFTYLLLLLYSPFVPLPSRKNAGHVAMFLRVTAFLTAAVIAVKLIFEIVLVSMPPYASMLPLCGDLEAALRIVGLIRLDKVPAVAVTLWVIPELLVLMTSIVLMAFFRKRQRVIEDPLMATESGSSPRVSSAKFKYMGSMGTYRYWSLSVYAAAATLFSEAALLPHVTPHCNFFR